jgi:uncharacterized protein RhaS with RHS repeats
VSRLQDIYTSATTGSYSYDCNGNMITRTEGSTTYVQAWTKENRIQAITNTATGQVAQYFYDGDGQRVKKIQNGQTTIYIGALYEKNITTGEVTTYYFAGAQRVAMRKNGGAPTWFIADHPRLREGKPGQHIAGVG